MYVKKILESMKLNLELPIIAQCDNKGAVDLDGVSPVILSIVK